MLLVVLMLWACATIKAQQVFQKPVVLNKMYTTSDCTGDAYVTRVEIQDVCMNSTYETSIESEKYTCINDVPSRTTYSGSATCTGTASTSPLYSTTCTR